MAEALSTDELVGIIEGKTELEVTQTHLMAGLPSGLRHQVVALAEVEGIFVQNMCELERGKKLFVQKLALEEKKIAVARSLMLKIMESEGVPTVKDEHVTVSVVKGRERVKCVDIDKVADEFKKMKPVADVAGAKAHLHDTGEVPDGFEVERGDPTVMVRRK